MQAISTNSNPPTQQILSVNSQQWLHNVLCEAYKVPSLRDFQLRHSEDINSGSDVFLVVATGGGKTFVLHSGMVAAQARGETGIAILVVPTKALAEQHEFLAKKHGLRAMAITEDTVRDAGLKGRDLFKELSNGDDIRVGIMSPQMLRSPRLDKCIKAAKMKEQMRWFLIDETHLVDDDESGTFLEAYRAIGIMRARLPSKTIWVAVTGTATPSRALVMAKILGFQPGHYVNARYSIDRPNIKYTPRFFEHSISGSTFLDLSFLVPFGMTSHKNIKSTLVFVPTIQSGYNLMQYLDSLLPSSLPNRLRTIKLYNSLMCIDYRQNFIRDFEDGSTLRIGIVTDTLTYGLDLRVYQVLVVGICPTPENQKQKMSRAGRDGLPAEAKAYAPGWVKDVPVSEESGVQAKEDAKRRAKLPEVTLQWYNPTVERCSRAADLEYNGESHDGRNCRCSIHETDTSGDLAMVRRWQEHFESISAESSREKVLRSDQTFKPLEKAMKDSLLHLLEQWKARKWSTIRGRNIGLTSDFFLPPYILSRIVDRAHVCSSIQRFRTIAKEWEYLDEYGEELLTFLTAALQEFMEVFWEGGEETVIEPELDDAHPPPRSLRLVLRPRDNEPIDDEVPMTPVTKRPSSSGNSPQKKRRRTRNSLKENTL